jgi:hypothetical protein
MNNDQSVRAAYLTRAAVLAILGAASLIHRGGNVEQVVSLPQK